MSNASKPSPYQFIHITILKIVGIVCLNFMSIAWFFPVVALPHFGNFTSAVVTTAVLWWVCVSLLILQCNLYVYLFQDRIKSLTYRELEFPTVRNTHLQSVKSANGRSWILRYLEILLFMFPLLTVWIILHDLVFFHCGNHEC